MTSTGPDDDRPHDPVSAVEAALRAAAPSTDAFAAARARFTARAVAANAQAVAYEDHESPLGPLRIAATSVGVVRVVLPTEDPDAALALLAARVSARIVRAPAPPVTAARRELDAYFAGDLHAFAVPLDWTLVSAFRLAVLHATARVPYGTTASYGQVAADAGNPRAVRAAGTALATNPLPVVVPCHRVVRSDGAPGRYLGGAAMKTRLLALEGAV